MFNFFRKKPPEEISRTTPGFEETERKTPKAGAILLIIMFIAGLFFGWRALDDLGRIPQTPPPLSTCSYSYQTAYLEESPVYPPPARPLYIEDYYPYSYDDPSRCTWSELEREHGIPAIFEERGPLDKTWNAIETELNQVQSSLYSVQDQINRLIQEYGVGIEEQEAGIENPLFPIAPSAQSITALRAEEQRLLGEQSRLQAQLASLESQRKSFDTRLTEAYKPVFAEQNRLLRWYEFKVFLLQFFVMLPFFWLAFRWYARLHRKNSPYAIIATGILAVAAILLLRVILFWFWGLFLERVLEVLLEWFRNFEIVRTIMFYLGMVLSFVVFGGAVYLLQKKVFDPRRVTIRRFRAKQCPHCQTNLDLATFYCPNCGHQLKEKCEKCGQARFVGLPSCPFCGDKK